MVKSGTKADINKNPKFSIVVPVYNADKYLDQCVQSIINQDIGLDNIELILVNDGSKDSSGAICKKYANKYPENIVYIDQPNAGVSEARNIGISRATGNYIGFVDADDYISTNTIRGVESYFKTASSDVDVAIVRVIQFGHRVSERPINTKFHKGTRTVDLDNPEWRDVYPRVAPSFIKSSVAKKHKFDKNIGIYEDTRYISEVLAESMKLGVVGMGVYYNRIHSGDNVDASITTGAARDKRLYLESPRSVSLHLLKFFKGKNKYPPLYFQYIALYEIRWRVFYNQYDPREILTESEYNTYEKINRKILDLISDEAIVSFDLYDSSQKIALLNMKHESDVVAEAQLSADNELIWRGLSLLNYNEDMSVSITDIYLSRREAVLEGFFSMPISKDVEIHMRVDGEPRDDLITYGRPQETDETTLLFGVIYHGGDWFKIRVPINDNAVQRVDFIVIMNSLEYAIDSLSILNPPRYGRNFIGNYALKSKMGGLIIHPLTSKPIARAILAKLKYLIELIKRVLRKVKRICIRMIKMLK